MRKLALISLGVAAGILAAVMIARAGDRADRDPDLLSEKIEESLELLESSSLVA